MRGAALLTAVLALVLPIAHLAPAQEAAPIVDLGGAAPAGPPAPAGTPGDGAPGDGAPGDGGLAGLRRDADRRGEAAPVLLPLRAAGRDDRLPRLVGERAALDLALDVPPAAATGPLRLVWRSTVNILAERSAWTIRINDDAPIPLPPPPVDGHALVTVEAARLEPGRNRIRLEAVQHHRIFCGPQATFDVWTEIDVSASGVFVAPGAIDASPEGFALALAAQVARDGRIVLHAAGEADPAALAALIGRVAAATGLGPGSVGVAPPPLVAGPAADIARVTLLVDAAPGATVRRGGDGAVTLVVAQGPDGALPDLSALLPPAAPEAGRTGPADLAPGTSVTLAGLGLATAETFNRYATLDVRFRLPDDWLLLASQDARLDLGYAFAEGLPRGSLMLVKVNGTTVRLLPLDRGGGAQPVLPVGFKARLLRPGVNLLRFEGIVPGDPADLPCVPRDTALWSVSAASRLTVPPSPRMAFPALAAALHRVGGDAVEPVTGAIVDPDLLPFRAMPPAAGGRLTVVALADAGLLSLNRLDLTRRAIEAALTPAAPPPPTADDTLLPDVPLFDLRFMADWARSLARGVVDVARPGAPGLAAWIDGRRGIALLAMPDAERPHDLWLILGPEADSAAVARALVRARDSEDAPQGPVALLDAAGVWHGWSPASVPPRLLEPLNARNLRAVLGNYASWSPILFTAVLLTLALASAVVAMLFAVRTRGRRKR
jgi:hypothetical protein